MMYARGGCLGFLRCLRLFGCSGEDDVELSDGMKSQDLGGYIYKYVHVAI